MLINNIIKTSKKPRIYSQTDHVMWTDDYISKQLLQVHLNEKIDLASRKKENIDRTIKWISKFISKSKIKILDLGCGPGLYTEYFAAEGHEVIGVDFSKQSIKYAESNAKKKKLNISYIENDYLKQKFEPNSFDLIILIYTDLGVLKPSDRGKLLQKVKASLKKGGFLIFDVLTDNDLLSKVTPRTWEASQKGFWQNSPYLALSESFIYENEKVILYQHIIIDKNNEVKTYRFWSHYFSIADLREELSKIGFKKLQFSREVLEKSNQWDGNNVVFCKAEK